MDKTHFLSKKKNLLYWVKKQDSTICCVHAIHLKLSEKVYSKVERSFIFCNEELVN